MKGRRSSVPVDEPLVETDRLEGDFAERWRVETAAEWHAYTFLVGHILASEIGSRGKSILYAAESHLLVRISTAWRHWMAKQIEAVVGG